MAAKILSALAIAFLAIIVILSLLTALASASASLANGVANAAASTALLTSQCMSGFMVLVALIAGARIGVTSYKFLNNGKNHQSKARVLPSQLEHPLLPNTSDPLMWKLPTRDDRLQMFNMREHPGNDADDVEDTLFKNWGW